MNTILKCTPGRAYAFEFTLAAELDVDWASCGLKWMVKERDTDSDADAIITKTHLDGITKDAEEEGRGVGRALASETALLDPDKTYYWELILMDGSEPWSLDSGYMLPNPKPAGLIDSP